MKKITILFTLLFSLSAWGQSTKKFLTISDIHFNPIAACENQAAPCETLHQLQIHDVSDWENILKENDSKPIFGKDTNYFLLRDTLNELSRMENTQSLQFVIFLGDILPHQFHELYVKFSGDSTAQGYSDFAVKTMQFVAFELKNHLQDTNVFFTTGNHDADEDRDYVPSVFFEKITPAWEDLIKKTEAKSQFKQQFPVAGYYSVDLNDFQLIVLNSNLFSTDVTEESVTTAARDELIWLSDQIKDAAIKNKKVIIAGHKPMAIDVNASLESSPIVINAQWKKEFSDAFIKLLNQYPDVVVGILMGHLHNDGFEIIHLKNKNIAMIQAPAISPIYFNQPGLKEIFYDEKSLHLTNAITAFYKMHDVSDKYQWEEEYNFNKIYQPDCTNCTLVEGMQRLTATNKLAEYFQKFYAVSEDAKPITKGYWSPYYWCAIRALTEEDYKRCIES